MKRRPLKYLFILLFSVEALAGVLQGRVVSIADGDTFTVLDASNKIYKVRLLGIDAPEKRQPFGNVAKNRLSQLIFKKSATVEFKKKDRYGRILGKVFCNGVEINVRLIQEGLAWHYKQFARDQTPADRKRYAEQEERARRLTQGLWTDKRPIPPWLFRETGRDLAKGRQKRPPKRRRW